MISNSPLQCVALSSEAGVRTLNDEDLFAYLCVHGAVHGWSRLKWLADFNAYIAGKTFEQLEHLYRHAQTRGAGLCAGQALLLCRWLLALQLPMVLEAELQECRRLRRLAKIALNVMAVPDPETELDMRRFGTTRVYLAQFLLGRGIKYFIWHCRIVSVSIDCMIAYPLPKFLYFLHPPLRISLWVWWRMRYFGFNTAAQTKAKRRNFKIKVREI